MSEAKLAVVSPETGTSGASESPPAPKGLPCVQLPCPCCNEPCANINLYLWTLDNPTEPNFICTECNGEFSIEDVRTFIYRWTRLLGWLEQIPDVRGE